MSVRRSKQRRLQKIQETEDRTNPTLQKEKKRKARILADLKKRQARQAAAEKKAAQAKAKQKRIEREEGPGQGTKLSRRERTERRRVAGTLDKSLSSKEIQQQNIAKAKKVYPNKADRDAAARRAEGNLIEGLTWVLGGPAVGLGIKVAVKGGQKLYKVGNKIYNSLKAARNISKAKQKGMKTIRQGRLTGPQKLKQLPKPPKRITDQRPPSVRNKPPAPSQAQFDKVVSGKRTGSDKIPDLKPPVVKKTPVVKKPTPVSRQTASGRGKKTEKPGERVAATTKKPTPVSRQTASGRGKKTEKPGERVGYSRQYQPPLSRRPSPFKPPTARGTPKVKTPTGTGGPKKNPFGGKYGGTWPKQGKWTPAVGRAKAVRALKNAGKTVTAKNIAKVVTGGVAGYGLSELLRDRKSGEKPPVPTGTKTRADLHKPYQTKTEKPVDRGKPGRTVGTKAGYRGPAVKGIVDTLAVGPKPKTQTRKETSSAKMAGRPEERRSRHVAEDKVAFLKSRGGTDKNINKGFEFNLVGKNKTAAEAKKAGDAAYKAEQADRKKISRQDHYQYGEGRRSKLKQVAKKGGTIRAKKGRAIVKKSYNTGGTVRFSSGGSVIDTYNYDN